MVEWGEKTIGQQADYMAEHDNQMIEMYGQKNPHWDAKVVKEEIRAALKRSLREKVASLEDDAWMFQGEGEKK